jgi:hypothetical protein
MIELSNIRFHNPKSDFHLQIHYAEFTRWNITSGFWGYYA